MSLRVAVLLLLPGWLQADTHAGESFISSPQPGEFSVCYDHSCTTVASVGLSAGEWRLATAALASPLPSAAAEREAIAQAVAALEEIVGRRNGTAADLGGNLQGIARTGQLDCIDESTNTTTYLRMFAGAGLLHHHEVLSPSTRFSIFAGPHTTAVIRETATGERYAVDSWFFDNGEAPYIGRLDVWRSGYDPRDD